MARGNERKLISRDERDRPAQVRKDLSQCLPPDAQARSAWRSAAAAYALRVTTVRFTCHSYAATAQDKEVTLFWGPAHGTADPTRLSYLYSQSR